MKKNNLTHIFLSFILVFGLVIVSCEDDSEVFTVDETAPVTLADLSITEIELSQTNVNNPAVTFRWNEADYGQQASENYAVELASDQNFTNPVTAISVTGTNSASLSVGELNNAAGNAGLLPFEWATIYARVVSSLGTQNGLPVNSNVISFQVYPFFNYAFDDYYLVGNAVAPGWDNNNNNPALFRDPDDSNVYYFTGYFAKNTAGDINEGRFKVLETKGLWQPQWGVTANEGDDDIITFGDIAGNPATQDGDPGRFGVETEGFYTFKIDFGNDNFTIDVFDASGASDFTSVTVSGSATGSGITLTQSAFDSHLWYANNVTLVPGELQFTTNDGTTWGNSTEFSGKVTPNGGSIPVVVEDEYDIWFSDLEGHYIMIPLNL